MAGSNSMSFITYNMHGFKQGASSLDHFCSENELNVDIIFLQEHWLTPDNLSKLKLFSNRYISYGISAMEQTVNRCVLKGRPWGGVCTLIRSTFGGKVIFVKCSERYVVIKLDSLLLINVYLPTIVNDADLCTMQSIFAEIDDIVGLFSNYKIVFAGDFNTNICINITKNEMLRDYIAKYDLIPCNNIINSNLNFTYFHETLQCSSYIDFICISKCIDTDLVEFKVLDLAYNLSDHHPVLARISIESSIECLPINKGHSSKQNDCIQRNLRWDHAALPLYYDGTRELLQPLFNNLNGVYDNWMTSQFNSGEHCNDYSYSELHGVSAACSSFNSFSSQRLYTCRQGVSKSYNNQNGQFEPISRAQIVGQIKTIYDQVIWSLITAADMFIPVVNSNYFKYWWNQEINELKAKSCATHLDWVTAGRPKHGPIYDSKRIAKSVYKKCINANQKLEKESVSNSLHDALVCKSTSGFWKSWHSKFKKKKSTPQFVEGLNGDQNIANGFAKYFSDVSHGNTLCDNVVLSQEFQKRLLSYRSTCNDNELNINIELLDSIIRGLNKGKAAGVDHLTAEHVQFSHPVLISILSMLFNLMLKYEYVPNAFGVGVIVPIPKNDTNCNHDKFAHYRGITISPVFSKIFELCILNNIKGLLATSDLQFGFKSGLGCNHAIYSVRETVSHLVSNNSTVNLCALDVAKAFDNVNHYVLYGKLMDRNIPGCLILMLSKWYSKIFATVKWNSCVSIAVKISSGVRQGGVLSPFLFAIFVDDILTKLKLAGLGCRIRGLLFNAIMYADDLLLMSISICDLQSMVDICVKEFKEIGLSINIKKSVCLRIGPRYKIPVSSISVDNSVLEWKSQLKYLGVTLLAGTTIKCNLQIVRQKYFRSLNGIFGKIGTQSSTAVTLSLINCFCVPVLTYGIEAFNITLSMYNILESAYSAAFSKIFSTYDRSIIRQCMFYCNMSPLCDLIDIRRLNFLFCLKKSNNFSMRFLFETSGKSELNNLLNKRCIYTENAGRWKHVIWDNFVNSFAL